MAVNPTAKKAGADPLWEEARELARLFAEVTIAFKRSDRQPRAELRAAAEGAGLGPRHAASGLGVRYPDALFELRREEPG